MLAAVWRAVCVNPDARLRGMARLRGWEIRHFRLGSRELAHPERLAALSRAV
jgi:phosphoserine phosphatase